MGASEPQVRPPPLRYGVLAKILYFTASFIGGYDQQMVGICMRAFEFTLGFSQQQMAIMVAVESIALLGCCLLWGYFTDNFDCKHVLSTGMFLAGTTTVLLGVVSNFYLILVLRFLHGFAMGCLDPVLQKIVSSTVTRSGHASTFGIIMAMYCAGRFMCAIITSAMSDRVLLGLPGWRISYVSFGLVCLMLAVAVFFGMIAKRRNKEGTDYDAVAEYEHRPFCEVVPQAFKKVFMKRTPILLIASIFTGEAPFCAFTYMVIYLQYMGVPYVGAGIATAVTLVGGVIGGVAGGLVVAAIERRFYNYGLLSCGNFLLLIRLTACLFLFLGPPPLGYLRWYHYTELLILGASFVNIGSVDRPIMTHVMRKNLQGTAWSITRSVSGVASSLVYYPLAGYLADRVFGYVRSTEVFENMSKEFMGNNARALKLTMLCLMVTGTVGNIACYIAIFFTYPRDKVVEPAAAQEPEVTSAGEV
ncbi:major facilitator superfamily member protein [Babesia caballi]|uniref:Major facilitator superfamily member protein n=1 Tax=Babesia caballi TaxID=5871 RepID=A0AAV4LQR4_BABCB|nr:major facilitator superfamily member protein [Babesia caballi]